MYDFGYSRPQTLASALDALGEDDAALPLSGGQTLIPVLRTRLAAPSTLVDLARLAELKGIKDEGGRLTISAAETHADVASSPIVHAALPALARLAGGIGDVQVRYRGTIGGSVANNDPAACYPSALLALDAEVVTNRRRLSAGEFFTGMFSTALEPGEIVTAISFSHCAAAHYEKFKNPASRFALIGVFAARLDGAIRIAITGGGTGVFRWRAAEAYVQDGGAIDALQSVPLESDLFTGDVHGSAEYRTHLAYVVTSRALAAIT
jgi:carbon-monoxide dehydrogenase medium subunit